jgi:methyl-accepting chemotaxis protein
MRRIAQEVRKAVGEQGRAARDVIKAAQSTTKLAVQVRKSTAEQTRSATEITQAVESMRRGAVGTARALSEQSAATEQVSRAAEMLARQAAEVARAMSEQGTAAAQVTAAVNSMRQESDQAARALAEQTRALRDVTTSAANTSKQIRLIHTSNRQHGLAATAIANRLAEVRRVTEQNATGVRETHGNTEDLRRLAQQLGTALQPLAGERNGSGRRPRSNGSR